MHTYKIKALLPYPDQKVLYMYDKAYCKLHMWIKSKAKHPHLKFYEITKE